MSDISFPGTVSASAFEDLAEAVAYLGSAQAYLILPQGQTFGMDGNLTIPENITLVPLGGIIEVGAYQLTVQRMAETGNIQAFDVDPDGLVVFREGSVTRVNAAWFGANGTGNTSFAASNRIAIQGALNSAIYGGARVPVRIPAGRYPVDDTLHAGYGVSGFHSVVIEGDGRRYAAGSGFLGTCLTALHADAPLINFQGMRAPVIRDITLEGRLLSYLSTNDLGGANPTPGIDDTDAANWIDETIEDLGVGRYDPYAAVSVDAYSGTEPDNPYPAVSYPAFLGGDIPQYGKTFTTQPMLSGVEIRGFVAGVVVQPSGADGNGDFLAVRDSQINYCIYGLSICNTQSRDVRIDRVLTNRVHTAITTNKHGAQTGRLDGEITDLALTNCIQVFDLGTTAIAGPVVFRSIFAERLWRIGTYAGTTSIEQAIIFDGGRLSFHSQAENDYRRGVPAYVIGSTTLSQGAQLLFRGVTLNNYPAAIGFFELSHWVQFDGCQFNTSGSISSFSEWERLAFQATCGGVVLANFGSAAGTEVREHTIKWSGYVNIDTPTTGAQRIVDGLYASARTAPIPLYAKYAAPNGLIPGDQIPMPVRSFAVAKSSLVSCTLDDGELEVELSTLPDAIALRRGPAQGDVIWDQNTGTMFWIFYRSGAVIRARIRTNWRIVSGEVVPIEAFSTTTGNLVFASTRFFSPSQPLFGDCAENDDDLTNCGTSEGTASFIDAQIAVGDALYIDSARDAFWHRDQTQVTARDQSTGIITLANDALRTKSHQRLPLWVRAAPANPS